METFSSKIGRGERFEKRKKENFQANAIMLYGCCLVLKLLLLLLQCFARTSSKSKVSILTIVVFNRRMWLGTKGCEHLSGVERVKNKIMKH